MQNFAEQVELCRLPAPNPGKFSGDSGMYPTWKAGFEALIRQKNIPGEEKLYHLLEHVSGIARETVQGFTLIPGEESFNKAMLLDHSEI